MLQRLLLQRKVWNRGKKCFTNFIWLTSYQVCNCQLGFWLKCNLFFSRHLPITAKLWSYLKNEGYLSFQRLEKTAQESIYYLWWTMHLGICLDLGSNFNLGMEYMYICNLTSVWAKFYSKACIESTHLHAVISSFITFDFDKDSMQHHGPKWK